MDILLFSSATFGRKVKSSPFIFSFLQNSWHSSRKGIDFFDAVDLLRNFRRWEMVLWMNSSEWRKTSFLLAFKVLSIPCIFCRSCFWSTTGELPCKTCRIKANHRIRLYTSSLRFCCECSSLLNKVSDDKIDDLMIFSTTIKFSSLLPKFSLQIRWNSWCKARLTTRPLFKLQDSDAKILQTSSRSFEEMQSLQDFSRYGITALKMKNSRCFLHILVVLSISRMNCSGSSRNNWIVHWWSPSKW